MNYVPYGKAQPPTCYNMNLVSKEWSSAARSRIWKSYFMYSNEVDEVKRTHAHFGQYVQTIILGVAMNEDAIRYRQNQNTISNKNDNQLLPLDLQECLELTWDRVRHLHMIIRDSLPLPQLATCLSNAFPNLSYMNIRLEFTNLGTLLGLILVHLPKVRNLSIYKISPVSYSFDDSADYTEIDSSAVNNLAKVKNRFDELNLIGWVGTPAFFQVIRTHQVSLKKILIDLNCDYLSSFDTSSNPYITSLECHILYVNDLYTPLTFNSKWFPNIQALKIGNIITKHSRRRVLPTATIPSFTSPWPYLKSLNLPFMTNNIAMAVGKHCKNLMVLRSTDDCYYNTDAFDLTRLNLHSLQKKAQKQSQNKQYKDAMAKLDVEKHNLTDANDDDDILFDSKGFLAITTNLPQLCVLKLGTFVSPSRHLLKYDLLRLGKKVCKWKMVSNLRTMNVGRLEMPIKSTGFFLNHFNDLKYLCIGILDKGEHESQEF